MDWTMSSFYSSEWIQVEAFVFNTLPRLSLHSQQSGDFICNTSEVHVCAGRITVAENGAWGHMHIRSFLPCCDSSNSCILVKFLLAQCPELLRVMEGLSGACSRPSSRPAFQPGLTGRCFPGDRTCRQSRRYFGRHSPGASRPSTTPREGRQG